MGGFDGDADLHVMLNMDSVDHDFEIPASDTKKWLKVIDTAQLSPADIAEPGQETAISGSTCHVESHSVVVLISILS